MKFRHHKYTWSKPFGSVRHNWELVGPLGGINFHVNENKDYGDSCGLEFHHNLLCGFRTNEAPHHTNCALVGGACWHDGTSLYATETLWPMIKPIALNGDHETIFKILEREYNDRFKEFEETK